MTKLLITIDRGTAAKPDECGDCEQVVDRNGRLAICDIWRGLTKDGKRLPECIAAEQLAVILKSAADYKVDTAINFPPTMFKLSANALLMLAKKLDGSGTDDGVLSPAKKPPKPGPREALIAEVVQALRDAHVFVRDEAETAVDTVVARIATRVRVFDLAISELIASEFGGRG